MYTRRAVLGLARFAPLLAAGAANAGKGTLRLTPPPRVRRVPTWHATPEPRALGIGRARDGLLYVPAGAVMQLQAPLLLYLHGARQGGSQADAFVPYAERNGVVLLAPDSRGPTWGLVHGDEAADVAFLDRALRHVFADCAIDPARIGIAGFSDGATAALSWGLVNGTLFRGIAAFSPGFVHVSAAPQGRPRVFITHGRSDAVFPIEQSSRRIVAILREAGYAPELREFDGGHAVAPELAREGLDSIFGNAG